MDASRERAIEALGWVNAERASRPDAPLWKLVDEAARRFDLDAARSEWLLRTAQGSGDACPTCGGALQQAARIPGTRVCGSGHLVPER